MTFMQSSHTGTNTGEFVSMYVTGRLASGPAGTMEPAVLVKAGAKTYSAGGRAGDLSGINVDGDGSFWAANEYAAATGLANWGTFIAHFGVAFGVISSSPADGSTLTAPPVSFTVTFDEALVPGSVQPGDLQV